MNLQSFAHPQGGAVEGSVMFLGPAVTLLMVLLSARWACGRQPTLEPSRMLSRPGSRQGMSKALGQHCPAELCLRMRLYSCSSALRPCCRLARAAMWPSVQELRCAVSCQAMAWLSLLCQLVEQSTSVPVASVLSTQCPRHGIHTGPRSLATASHAPSCCMPNCPLPACHLQ